MGQLFILLDLFILFTEAPFIGSLVKISYEIDLRLGLKLIDKTDIKNQDPNWPAFKKYFMHGTSHYIGLDTHDVGSWTEPIKAGMAFTCEPGIYIPAENLGIRLEDDLIVQAKGEPLNLMRDIPIEADHIEELMNA